MVIKVDFKHIHHLETLCPSFEVVVEYRIQAEVFIHDDAVKITSIQVCVSSVYQQGTIWEEIPIPAEPMSQDNKKMMALFREMARNVAYKKTAAISKMY